MPLPGRTPDDRFTQAVATPVVSALLASIVGLHQISAGTYRGLGATVEVLLLRCDSAGNYARHADQPPPDSVNRVELVCFCQGPQRYDEWEELARRIAGLLAWEVADDETDEILHRPADPGHRSPAAYRG